MAIPACVEPKCDGLIVHVGVHERVHKKALQLARRIVKRNLRGKWVVEPLGRRSRDFEVTRAGKRKTIAVGTAWNYVRKLEKDRDVVDAEPTFEIAGLEPDPQYVTQQLTPKEQVSAKSVRRKDKSCSDPYSWSITNARLDRAWKVPLRPGGKRFGKGTKVGHPDTGYTHHPEIWHNPAGKQRLKSGYDFVDDDATAYDPLSGGDPSHGTKTSSVIMSDIGSGTGAPFVTGAAPAASLVAYRTIKSVVVFNFKNVAKAIYRATDLGDCHVISMSLGGPIAGEALPRAISYAVEHGVILLAAAGNYWPWVVYPAKHDEVIAIAASNCSDEPWSSSASGKSVDVSAPGESVWAAVTEERGNQREFTWAQGNGTSYAVAATAGACALWLAHHGRKKLIQKYGRENLASVFKELLVTHGVRTPRGWKTEKYGSGILDAEQLLKARLRARPRAKGMSIRPKGTAMPTDPVTELCEYFPGYGVAAARGALAKELRMKETALDDFLAEHGDEVTFHVATNAGFRQSVENRLKRRRAKSAKQNRQLAKQASSALKKALKI